MTPIGMTAMGIDIGGTKTAVVVLDERGKVLEHRQAASGRGPGSVVAVAVDLAARCAAGVGGWAAVGSVGACMPGVVDPRLGVVTHAVNLAVDSLDLAAELGAALGRPVTVDNDVKAAGLGAYRLEGGDDAHAFAYLNVGTGLAAALVVGGRIVRGPGGFTGEIGHLPLATPLPCRCGQTGCLEASASGSALTRMWPPAQHRADPFAAAAAGDTVAAEAVQLLCSGIATAIQVLVLAGGVEKVVVGGGLTALGAPLADGVASVLHERASRSPLLAGMDLPRRFSLLTSTVPIAALGAALLPAAARLPEEVRSWKS